MSRLNLHTNVKTFVNLIFGKLLKPKLLFLLGVIVAINKFQRSRLTFELSAKVAHIGIPSMY